MGGVLGQQGRDELRHRVGGAPRAQVGWRVVDDPTQERAEGLVGADGERWCTRHELVEGRAERVEVRGRRRRLAVDDLRCGVREAGRDRHGLRAAVSRDAGDAEVGQHRRAVGRGQHVGGLEVAVGDPRRVRGGQRVRQLAADPKRLLPTEGAAAGEPVGERATRQVGHHQVGPAAGREPGVVHRHDPGVLGEFAEGLALALEATPRAVVHLRGDDLDRDRPLEGRLEGPVHDGEAAGADADGVGEPREVELQRVGHRRSLTQRR